MEVARNAVSRSRVCLGHEAIHNAAIPAALNTQVP